MHSFVKNICSNESHLPGKGKKKQEFKFKVNNKTMFHIFMFRVGDQIIFQMVFKWITLGEV